MDITTMLPTILAFCLLILVMFYAMLDIYFTRKDKYDKGKLERTANVLNIFLNELQKVVQKNRDENKG